MKAELLVFSLCILKVISNTSRSPSQEFILVPPGVQPPYILVLEAMTVFNKMLHYLLLESLTFADFRILTNERACDVSFACSHQPHHFVANVFKHVDGRYMLLYTTFRVQPHLLI